MLLKSVKFFDFSKASIAARLWWAFALSCCFILLMVSTLLYYSLVHILEKAGHEFLVDEIATITHILHNQPNDTDALKQEVVWNPSPTKVRNDRAFFYYIRLLDEQGQILMATPNMHKITKDVAFPRAIPVSSIPRNIQHWQSPNGDDYLLLSVHTRLGGSAADTRIIQIALDISYQTLILHEYWLRVIELLILGSLFAAFVGSLVARVSMARLQDLTKTAKAISVNDLGVRFDPEHLPQELHELAIAGNEMLTGLEDAFKRLSQFSSDLAHELRTPFNNLMGEAEIALSRSRTPEEYRQVIESSLEEYQRLSQMVESMLFLARTENVDAPVQPQPINVAEQIEKICEFHEPIAAEKNIQVKYHGQAIVQADPHLFRRAVSNLLSNALQYTPENGNIQIRILPAENGSIQIDVEDNGIGIPKEHLPHIFSRFYRVDNARSQSAGNSGLGLAIVASIMELHNGKVHVSSEPGEYTITTLVFPN